MSPSPMRVKLHVAHTERKGEPRTYVLEQDVIVVGRAGTCDIPLDDPDRVVSKQHAEIRSDGDAVRVFDMGSKNHTFIDGARVGTAGALVADRAVLQVGPFEIRAEIDRDRLVADDLDRTVFGAAFDNPFADEADALAAAITTLRRAYGGHDDGHRLPVLRDALRDALGADADALLAVLDPAAAPAAAPGAPVAPALTPSPGAGPVAHDLDNLFGPPVGPEAAGDPFAPAPLAQAPFAGPVPLPSPSAQPPSAATPDDLHLALAEALARLISIPGKFRHEFLGHTVIHAPESAFLFSSDAAALLRHLAPPDAALRAERLGALDASAEAVLVHHQSLLEGYRAAARAGAQVLVDGLDPDTLTGLAEGGGLLQGSRDRALLDLVRQRCAVMRSEDFAAAERRVYRPAFSQAYLDAIAHAAASP